MSERKDQAAVDLINHYTISKNSLTAYYSDDKKLEATTKSWVNREIEGPSQFIDMEHFYDALNVNSPYIDVGFLDENKNWVSLYSKLNQNNDGNDFRSNMNNNNIVSCSITDNGVKTLTLVLYDRTFYTIQELLYVAIQAGNGNVSSFVGEKSKTYGSLKIQDNEGQEVVNDISFFKQNDANTIKNNIRINYGWNVDVETKTWHESVTGDTEKKLRWNSQKDSAVKNTFLKKEIDEATYNISHSFRLTNKEFQTRVYSGYEEFFITNVESELSDTGVKYTITATGTDNYKLNGYKMLQKWLKLTAKPTEILAALMKSFNSTEDGVKLYWIDERPLTNGEKIGFNYETNKYEVINDQNVDEIVDNYQELLKNFSEHIRVMTNLKACLVKNKDHSISFDPNRTTEIYYDDAFGYEEDKQISLNKKNPFCISLFLAQEDKDGIRASLTEIAPIFKMAYDFQDIITFKSNDAKFSLFDIKKGWIATIANSAYNVSYDSDKISQEKKDIENYRTVEKFKDLFCNHITTVSEAHRNTSNLLRGNILSYPEAVGIADLHRVSDMGSTNGEYTFSDTKTVFIKVKNSLNFKSLFKVVNAQYGTPIKTEEFYKLSDNINSTNAYKELSGDSNLMSQIKQRPGVADYFNFYVKFIKKGLDINSIMLENTAGRNRSNMTLEEMNLKNNMQDIGNSLEPFKARSKEITEICSIIDWIVSTLKSIKGKYKLEKNITIETLNYDDGDFKSMYKNTSFMTETDQDIAKKLKDYYFAAYMLLKQFSQKKYLKKENLNRDQYVEKVLNFDESDYVLLINNYDFSYNYNGNYYLLSNIDGLTYQLVNDECKKLKADFDNFLNGVGKYSELGLMYEKVKEIDNIPDDLKYKNSDFKEIVKSMTPSISPKSYAYKKKNANYSLSNYITKNGISGKNAFDEIYSCFAAKYMTESTEDNIVKKIDETLEFLNAQQKEVQSEYEKILNSGVNGEITLMLGGKESQDPNKSYYKTLSSLFNDFCSQCPPYQDASNIIDSDGNVKMGKRTIKDENDNEVEIDVSPEIPKYNLTWEVLETVGDNLCIGFRYKKPVKIKGVRKYHWGTGNPKPHSIVSLSVKSNSEYAMLASSTSISASNNGTEIIKNSHGTTYKTNNAILNNAPFYVRKVASDSNKLNVLEANMSTNLVNGSITVLGDPSLRFGCEVQPYTYPIYLDIKFQKENTWGEGNGSIDCYMSGFYVVSKITHQITQQGYLTTLDITRYPGIKESVWKWS